MKKNKEKSVGNGIYITQQWEFNSQVAEKFDQHIEKSVPLYHKGHDLILEIIQLYLKKYKKEKITITDLGCSTGLLTQKISFQFKERSLIFYNIDIEAKMIELAKQRNYSQNHKIFWEVNSIENYSLQKSDIVIAYYILQFVNPLKRHNIISNIYHRLNKKGLFLFFEKVKNNNQILDKWQTELLIQFKLQNGFTIDEIKNKEKSLKGVLISNTTEENLYLLNQGGFKNCSVIFKYLNFEGILAIK